MASRRSEVNNGFNLPLEKYGSTDDTLTFANREFTVVAIVQSYLVNLNWAAAVDKLMPSIPDDEWRESVTLLGNEADDEGEDGPLVLDVASSKSRDDPGTFFNDGKKKIDFVIVYEEEKLSEKQQQKKEKEAVARRDKGLPPTEEELEGQKHEMWRKNFLENIRKAGLVLEEDAVETEKKLIIYYKVHAPWQCMIFFAEELGLKAPLQAQPNPHLNWSERILTKLKLPNPMLFEFPFYPVDFYTCSFRRSKIHKFVGSSNRDTFFTNTDRIRVVNEILQNITYGKRKRAEVGIDRLLEEDVFQAAFPLHDGPEEYDGIQDEKMNRRQVLRKYWARWGAWYKYQPLDHIREYFGEKTAIYFAWLGMYTAWLLPASIIGILVFLYGIVTSGGNVPAIEICESNMTYKMCPLCDENIGCRYWYLSSTCSQAEMSYLFDHLGTVFFSIFMSFWAVTFLEYWKRKQASLAYHWDCMDFEEEEERPRPQFAAQAPLLEKNPITGILEPYFPEDMRKRRWLTGIGVLVGMVSLVLIFMLGVIMYRVLVSIPLFQSSAFRAEAQSIASSSGAVVNLVLIMVLGQVYQRLAGILNDWEMHRTQTEYEDNLTFKVFIFQFMNFFSSVFYIAFFKGKFVGYPGNYVRIFGLRNEDCGSGGCLIELAQQLVIIMVGKQIINNCQELIIPKLKQFILRYKVSGSPFGRSADKNQSRWEEDYQLVPNEGLFEEYLEMIIQFGFITVFVAAFPLAPLFALLNNWIEIRLDAQKFIGELRRGVADRAQDIGIWYDILEFTAQLAVISNGFLIAFTSQFLPRLLYHHDFGTLEGYTNFTLSYSTPNTTIYPCRYVDYRDIEGNHTIFYYRLLALKLGFVILFEHFVFGVSRAIDFAVPDVPGSLEVKIKREAYLAKQALQEVQEQLHR